MEIRGSETYLCVGGNNPMKRKTIIYKKERRRGFGMKVGINLKSVHMNEMFLRIENVRFREIMKD